MSRYGTRRSGGSRRYSLAMMLTGWAAVGLAVILVGGTLYGYVKYRNVLDGISHERISGLGNRPPKLNNALNILVIGSDSRSGRNGKIGGPAQGQRSDTVMIAHISPGGGRISVLSFPRDSVVPIYSCPSEPGFPGQSAAPGSVEQLNSSFAAGGANCLWKALEHTTGIHLDNFIQLNFTGFISVINAIGGVPVCLPTAIHATRYDRLHLKAGRHVLKGLKALEFWRLREDFGLGSDLQRIQRDQLLMVGLVQKILKTGVLHSLGKTWGIIDAISKAHALTTDAGLTTSRIVTIARSVSGISKKSIQFIEVPTVTYPANPNWVEFDTSRTPKLFSAIERDRALPKVPKAKKSQKAKKTKTQPPKLLSASSVSVTVLNGSGVQGIAGTTAAALGTRGFHVLGTASATSPSGADDYSYTKSVAEYSVTADLAAAQTVAAQLPDVTLKQVSTVTAGTVTLILGSDFTKLGPPPSQPVGNLTGQFGGYKGSTNACRSYGTAFQSVSG
ncbi:MAG TPA: LCP family protein [Streptosporangiaceae bacterium]|nr:LCP family protein [Streptosporangiaceae bacterium]